MPLAAAVVAVAALFLPIVGLSAAHVQYFLPTFEGAFVWLRRVFVCCQLHLVPRSPPEALNAINSSCDRFAAGFVIALLLVTASFYADAVAVSR